MTHKDAGSNVASMLGWRHKIYDVSPASRQGLASMSAVPAPAETPEKMASTTTRPDHSSVDLP